MLECFKRQLLFIISVRACLRACVRMCVHMCVRVFVEEASSIFLL